MQELRGGQISKTLLCSMAETTELTKVEEWKS